MSRSALTKFVFASTAACLLSFGSAKTSNAQYQQQYQMSIASSSYSINLGDSIQLTVNACPGMYNSVYFYEGGYPGDPNSGTLIGNGYSPTSFLTYTPTSRGTFGFWASGQAEYCTDKDSNYITVTVN